MICRRKRMDCISHQQKFVLTGFLLQARDPNPNVQPVETDFDCSGAEAERLIEEMQSIGKKVSEEMQLGSPSSE